MRAAQISEYGDPSVVKVVDVDKPEPKPSQVLVEVHAASLNPFDTTVRSGVMKESMPLSLPLTLGGDIAGVVVAMGEGVDSFSVGDKVFGQANAVAGNSGAFAEFAATNANELGRAPGNISMLEAASLPLVGLSARQALVEHINLQPGQKIFIIGGAGNIGQVAIQIAKHVGAYVATNATGEGLEVAKRLGADEVFDFKTQDFTESLKDFDAVFDTAGGDGFSKSFSILKPGGIAVTMIAQFDPVTAEGHGIQAMVQGTKTTTEALTELCELVESGVVKPLIGKTFTLDQIQEAFQARESGEVTGKIVLDIKAT
jgi:NADPH:quinone reductase-like Zn-dependent oxidoreductase